jgi:plasmid maintenance system antidote protein VapI
MDGPGHPFERDWTVGPWEIVAETLEERRITPSMFAMMCDTTTEAVERLLDGRDRIGLKWAEALARELGVSAEFWLALQRGFDEDLDKGRLIV